MPGLGDTARKHPPPSEPAVGGEKPRPGSIFLAFLRIGATAFGGPAMVPYIGGLAVRRRWLSREEFAEGVALCQSIPGATAMQTAAFVGLRAAGPRGAIAAYAGFGLPAVALMIAASAAYARALDLAVFQSTFRGLRAVIVALIANAAFMFARRHVRSWVDGLVALGCAAALYLGLNPVAAIAGAIAIELLLQRRRPAATPGAFQERFPGAARAAARIALGGLVLTPVLFALAPRLGALALVCVKIDAVAFGGGFASIPLMFHEMVEVRHWVPAMTFIDGIALGQVTPGPIVVTTTFVGYQFAGLAGALVATVAVFFPSFLLVVAVAPWFDRLRARPWFAPALRGALLSFVGLLVFVTYGIARTLHWNFAAGALSVVAFVALRAGVSVPLVVLASAVAAVVLM